MELPIIKWIGAKRLCSASLRSASQSRPSSSFILHPSSLLLLLASCLLFFPACTSTPSTKAPGRPRIQAEQAYNAGRDAFQRGNWSEASQSFERAADAFAVVDDFGAEATARHNQASALRRSSQLDAAIAAYEKSMAINRRLKRDSERGQNLAGLAQCYRAQNKLDQAIQSGEEALKLAGSNKGIVATIENDLALTLLQRGEKEDQARVVQLLKSAQEINASARNQRSLSANYLNLGRAYLMFGQLDSAESQLQKALEGFRSTDDPLGLAHTHELLGKLYLKREDKDKARFHLMEAKEKFEFLKDESSVKRVDQLMP